MSSSDTLTPATAVTSSGSDTLRQVIKRHHSTCTSPPPPPSTRPPAATSTSGPSRRWSVALASDHFPPAARQLQVPSTSTQRPVEPDLLFVVGIQNIARIFTATQAVNYSDRRGGVPTISVLSHRICENLIVHSGHVRTRTPGQPAMDPLHAGKKNCNSQFTPPDTTQLDHRIASCRAV